MATQTEEINAFLSQVKSALNSKHYQILDKRQKYLSTLARLGIIKQDVLQDIKDLTANDNWTKKADNNPSFPGDVWICKKFLHNECIYIKLKIQIADENKLFIMSYHIDGI